jgi:hypothetical protein
LRERQEAKALVLEYFAALQASPVKQIGEAIAEHTAAGYSFRGVHPFNEIHSVEELAEQVWVPLHTSFSRLQRRQDIFFAGPNLIDGTMWVTSMGKLMGLFDEHWLGIPPTGKIAQIPYCEFHRIENGKIAESALWLDIISVMKQAGLNPLSQQTGAEIINPGPLNSDGLLLEPQDEDASKQTLDLIMAMCNEVVGAWKASATGGMEQLWHDDMTWFGPSGIGATYTIDRYIEQHQRPFRSGLGPINFNGHVMEHAEGNYGGWFGWPNIKTTQGDGFLGLAPSDPPTEMRVVDIYRRHNDKLAENWIFIDLPHYLLPLGIDVLDLQDR